MKNINQQLIVRAWQGADAFANRQLAAQNLRRQLASASAEVDALYNHLARKGKVVAVR